MIDTLESATGYHQVEPDGADLFSEESTDEELFSYAKQGHQDAWTILVNRLQPILENIASRHKLDLGIDPSDVAQDVLLKLYNKRGQFDEGRGSIRSWLFQSLKNYLIDLRRKAQRRIAPVSLQAMDKLGGTYDPIDEDPQLQHMETTEEVEWLLPQIEEKYSRVLWQYAGLDITPRVIAESERRKEATIRWRIAEAKKEAEMLLRKRYNGDINGNLR